jgi:pteridine reductase
MHASDHHTPKVALVTGAAKRIGAEIARQLHGAGFNVAIHYNNSSTEAQKLIGELNSARENSAVGVQADLNNLSQVSGLATQSAGYWQRLDVLVNNASSFYHTPVGKTTAEDWDNLMNSNLKAPFFLSQALAPALDKSHGSIINIADIYAQRPLRKHTVYSIAKAGNEMLTKSLAGLRRAPYCGRRITTKKPKSNSPMKTRKKCLHKFLCNNGDKYRILQAQCYFWPQTHLTSPGKLLPSMAAGH